MPIGSYLAVLGLFSLYLLLFLTLTLMLDAFFNARGPVLGISIGIAIASMRGAGGLLKGYAPWLVKILPVALPALANTIVTGKQLPSDWPVSIVAISMFSALFAALAIWRFRQEEF